MLVVSPASIGARASVDSDGVVSNLNALGSEKYGSVCLSLFARRLHVDHWAMYRHGRRGEVKCIVNHSNSHSVAAEANVEKFVARYHLVDPTLKVMNDRDSVRSCVVKMKADDVEDRNYRECFDRVHVHERMSYLSTAGSDFIQLCVFRSSRPAAFTDDEVTDFLTWAQIITATAPLHEMLVDRLVVPSHIDQPAILQRLEAICPALSQREREVCAHAAAGKTIDETALELGIARTSIITYRQRAYQKLDISRPNELISLIGGMRDPQPARLS